MTSADDYFCHRAHREKNIKMFSMKHLQYILFASLFFYFCSKSLSPIDIKVQGKWKMAKGLKANEVITHYEEITFDNSNFQLEMIYITDLSTGSGMFNVSGSYIIDSNLIYLEGIYTKQNYANVDDHLKKKYENIERSFNKKLIYEFSGDTLILSEGKSFSEPIYDDNSFLDQPIYLLKDTNK